jgi:sterol-4alpha-carboxylate 3-dehydrogenase (decarboxylating)
MSSKLDETPKLDPNCTYLVIGGAGFLGRWVVNELLKRNVQRVRIFDLRKPVMDTEEAKALFGHPRVEVIQGDVTDPAAVEAALKDVDTCFHTASPVFGSGHPNRQRELYFKVNVQGTRNVIAMCRKQRVPRLVYTSSSGVVFNGKDLHMADETLPPCKRHMDAYNESKAAAEAEVLRAHGAELATVALRPSAIFGPYDVQAWPQIIAAGRRGKTKYQIGNGKNRNDYTYVENAALAHVLAAARLQDAAGRARVGGRAYFITNGEPLPFWEMPRYVARGLGFPEPRIRVPFLVAYVIACLVELFVFLLRPFVLIHPTFTRNVIIYATANRTFSIRRAEQDLGYTAEVRIPLAEGMWRTLEHFKAKEAQLLAKR